MQEKKRAYRRAVKFPTVENLVNYKITRAKSRRIFRESKRRSFRDFVSKINSQTPLNRVWKMIRKLKGTDSDSPGHLIRADGSVADRRGHCQHSGREAGAQLLIRNSHTSISAQQTTRRKHTHRLYICKHRRLQSSIYIRGVGCLPFRNKRHCSGS